MNTELTTFVTPFEEEQNIISGVQDVATVMYCSFEAKTKEEKVALYNAINTEGTKLKTAVNKVLKLRDVIIMPAPVTDNATGEQKIIPRCILILEDGTFMNASSWGVYKSLQRIKSIFGDLHFEEPLQISPVEASTKRGNTINLKLM